MPAPSPSGAKQRAAKVSELGRQLRARREALGVSATVAAEAAGISRVTLYRIENGFGSVNFGAYVSALQGLGLDFRVVDARVTLKARPKKAPPTRATHSRASRRPAAAIVRAKRASLPRRITLANYPELQRLAWSLGGVTTLTPKDALALYERNWRHIDEISVSDKERELVRRLSHSLGGGRLLV